MVPLFFSAKDFKHEFGDIATLLAPLEHNQAIMEATAMPYRYELTWIPDRDKQGNKLSSGRWRKRYKSRIQHAHLQRVIHQDESLQHGHQVPRVGRERHQAPTRVQQDEQRSDRRARSDHGGGRRFLRGLFLPLGQVISPTDGGQAGDGEQRPDRHRCRLRDSAPQEIGRR